ncbi:nucleotidyltransferase family protein [Campylobacter mucosalis]|nr:nucleotidyltransferase domain-containing protein [Campylobacter mucosalis]
MKSRLKNDGIDEIGLFGSYAKDNADTNSDIDIILLTNSKFLEKFGGLGSFAYLDKLRLKISNKFKKSVDICTTSSAKKLQDDFFKDAIYAR